jgi:hypothetical protein
LSADHIVADLLPNGSAAMLSAYGKSIVARIDQQSERGRAPCLFLDENESTGDDKSMRRFVQHIQ